MGKSILKILKEKIKICHSGVGIFFLLNFGGKCEGIDKKINKNEGINKTDAANNILE